jgi:hypothetical protein
MGTDEIKSEISTPPAALIQKNERLRISAESFPNDYLIDTELIAFSILDHEDFCETA